MGSGGDEERGWILEEGNVGCNVFFNEDPGKDSKIQTSQIKKLHEKSSRNQRKGRSNF